MTARNRTAVVLFYRKNRRNYRLLFGAVEKEIRRGWHRKIAVVTPGTLFAYEQWEANSYGTQRWTIVVCRAASGGSVTQILGIRPGANLLLKTQGRTKSKRFLACLDGLKSQVIAPEMVSDRDWMELNLALELSGNVDAVLAGLVARTLC